MLADADDETSGFQINLNRGENRLGLGVNKGNVRAGPGRLYYLTVTVENSPATGQPTINGTAQVGQTLTVDTSGISDADGLDNVTYSYQWLSSRDTEIDGATSSTYTFQSSDNGKLIKVRVTFTDDAGYDESLTSEAAVAVAATVPTEPLSLTVATGDQDQQLEASWQAPSSNGGSAVTGYKVQWKESTDSWDTQADVSEATVTGTSHTITSLTGGVEYTVRVIASNVAGDGPPSTEARATPTDSPTSGEEGTETVESDSTAAWTATLTVGVSGSGSETVWGYSWFLDGMGTLDGRTYNEGDQTIEVMAILLSNGFVAFNVRPHPSVDFVLTVDGTQFASADASEVKSRTLISYVWASTLDWAEDDRVALSLTLKGTDSAEQSEPAENTPATGVPTISGTPQVGQDLTADTSAIADEDGLDNVEYSYQWIGSNGNSDTDIENATDSTYTPSVSDVGKTIKVKVSFTDDANNDESLTSVATTAVAATVPTAPLSLTVVTGDQIQELDVSWQAPSSNGGAEIAGYKVQWKESADNWDTEADVSEATVTGNTHTITGLTGGTEYAVRVIATNTAGDGPASDEVAGTPAGGTSQQQTGDSTSPTVSSIAITSDPGTDEVYAIGDAIQITVTFSSDVTVTGKPQLELDIGGKANAAEHESNAGSEIVFAYTVAEGDSDSDGIAISENKLTLNGGAIKDASDNAADLDHVALEAQPGHEVDGVRPTISGVRPNIDFYKVRTSATRANVGDLINVSVDFTEEIFLDGSPHITLDIDSAPRVASFSQIRIYCPALHESTSNSVLAVGIPEGEEPPPGVTSYCFWSDTHGITMLFQHTVAKGDLDTDGVGIPANSLSLNGGTLRDAAGNDAVITHEAVADNPSVLIDGVPPEITSIEITSDPGEDDTYAEGDTIKFNVTFSEDLEFGLGWTRLRLDIGGKTRMAYRVSRDILDIRSDETGYIMAYSYTVADGDNDEDGISFPANALHKLKAQVLGADGNRPIFEYEAIADNAGHKVATATTAEDDTDDTQKTGFLMISGTLNVGETVNADFSNVDDEDGVEYAVSTAYFNWTREGGEGGLLSRFDTRYIIAGSDQGKRLRVSTEFFDDNGNLEYLYSPWTEPVGPRVPSNSAPTGLPAISGTPKVDQTLTANTSSIDDGDGLDDVSYEYQWIADGTDIDGATGSNYVLTSSEQGQTIQVRVAFTDDADNEETLTSEATVAVVAAAPAPLTAAFQDLPDSHDGSTAFTFRVLFSEDVGISYVNMRDDAFSLSEGDVTGARRVDGRNDLWEITVEPDDNSDVGITLPANRSCTTTGAICTREDSPRQLTNSPAATVTGPAEEPPTNTSAAGAPTISGTPRVEQTLTADTSSITDEDGLTNVSYSYQWMAGGSDIAGATGSTYTLTYSEQGQTIQVRVTFTDDADNEETLTSIATVAVAAAPNREATGKPAISGTPQVAQTLTADTSPIADEDGLENVSYSYQWTAGGTDIDGATGDTYTLTASQQGQTIQVKVTFTDDRDNAEALTSIATAAVAAAPEPLTVRLKVAAPTSHDGSSEFTFEIEFSEEFGISYATLRDHAFTVTSGSVETAQRTDKPSNIPWLITVKPQGTGDVTIELPATTDCDAEGAICTSDGRMLSNEVKLTVTGPDAANSRDTTAPTISSVAMTSDPDENDADLGAYIVGRSGGSIVQSTNWASGVYRIGDDVQVTVTFSENVTVTGSPQLELAIGSNNRTAGYESTDGSAVVFSYTVAVGDSDSDGIAVAANKLTLNGGSVKDAANNDADLSHNALTAQAGHEVDGVRPRLKLTVSDRLKFDASSGGTDGAYTTGEELIIRVAFTEGGVRGSVTGPPRVALNFDGGEPRVAKWDPSLIFNPTQYPLVRFFSYVVQEGDLDSDGPTIDANAIDLAGGFIRDAAGNDAVLTHSAVAASSSFIVDAVAPTVSSIAITSDPGSDDTYGTGDKIEVTVTFSESMNLPGSITCSPDVVHCEAELELDIGGTARTADYQSHTGADVVYAYTVQAGDTDDNGISIGANKLTGQQIRDAAGRFGYGINDADLSHDAVTDDSGHKVSGTS